MQQACIPNIPPQVKIEDVKKTYGDAIKDLNAMAVTRPAKPEPAKVTFVCCYCRCRC